jgi:hypothetical protein
MEARRARVLIASSGIAALALSVWVTPVAAACALSAPDSVAIGSPLVIEGSGFPASTSVDVSITVEGGSPDEFSVQSDASGALQINITPESADAGVTTIVASSGPGCTVQVVVGVGVPAPTDAPDATEGAPGAETPPRTDTGELAHSSPSLPASPAWLLAGLLFLIGVGGVYATRPVRIR